MNEENTARVGDAHVPMPEYFRVKDELDRVTKELAETQRCYRLASINRDEANARHAALLEAAEAASEQQRRNGSDFVAMQQERDAAKRDLAEGCAEVELMTKATEAMARKLDQARAELAVQSTRMLAQLEQLATMKGYVERATKERDEAQRRANDAEKEREDRIDLDVAKRTVMLKAERDKAMADIGPLRRRAEEAEAKLAQHEKEECMPRSVVEPLLDSKLPCGHPNNCGYTPDGKGIHIYCKWCQEITTLRGERDAALARAVKATDRGLELVDERDEVKAALAELVACKDLKDRMENWPGGTAWAYDVPEDFKAVEADYKRRKPLAWEAARLLQKDKTR